MKRTCPECGIGKPRRLCKRASGLEICSACCAGMRSAECGDCVHYSAALQYEETRHGKVFGLPQGEWMMEVSPEVQESVNEALNAAQRGHFQSAMDTLNALLPDHPLHHDVPYGIGLVHAIQGRYEESIQWFDRAIRIHPFSIEAHFNKAVSFQKLLDVPNCIRSYQKVVAIGPNSDPEVAKARAIIHNMASAILRTDGVGLDAYLNAGDRFNEAFAARASISPETSSKKWRDDRLSRVSEKRQAWGQDAWQPGDIGLELQARSGGKPRFVMPGGVDISAATWGKQFKIVA